MPAKRELWQTFKVGDRVRVVELPREFLVSGAVLHSETRRAYKYLVKRRRPLVVWMIDEYGFPWVKFQFRGRNGRMEYHSMALNHSGIAIANRRRG
jgi:hypothetical protein